MQKRKLQVFVSSTYLDLREERQAAVEAILSAGHIPAGMELFAAGDQSQWQVIKEWIEESDVYMLILGGRYGSIETESGKSYSQLEYEYALNLGKPLFSVVITPEHLEHKVKEQGASVPEQANYPKLQEFKQLVESKMVRFWNDMKDIKLAIHETLNQYSKREELIGWIPGNQGVNGAGLAEEIARLGKENDKLRNKVEEYEALSDGAYGMSIDKFVEILEGEVVPFEPNSLGTKRTEWLLRKSSSTDIVSLLLFFRAIAKFADGKNWCYPLIGFDRLSQFGLLDLVIEEDGYSVLPKLTEVGKKVLVKLIGQGEDFYPGIRDGVGLSKHEYGYSKPILRSAAPVRYSEEPPPRADANAKQDT